MIDNVNQSDKQKKKVKGIMLWNVTRLDDFWFLKWPDIILVVTLFHIHYTILSTRRWFRVGIIQPEMFLRWKSFFFKEKQRKERRKIEKKKFSSKIIAMRKLFPPFFSSFFSVFKNFSTFFVFFSGLVFFLFSLSSPQIS